VIILTSIFEASRTFSLSLMGLSSFYFHYIVQDYILIWSICQYSWWSWIVLFDEAVVNSLRCHCNVNFVFHVCAFLFVIRYYNVVVAN